MARILFGAGYIKEPRGQVIMDSPIFPYPAFYSRNKSASISGAFFIA